MCHCKNAVCKSACPWCSSCEVYGENQFRQKKMQKEMESKENKKEEKEILRIVQK